MNARRLFDRTLIRFLLAGAINTAAGSGIMFTLYNALHLSYWLSSACSHVFASILSFFLNKYFTFGVRRRSVFMVIAFAVNIAVCYAAAYGAAKPAVNFLLRGSPQNLRENTALFAGMCLFTGLNYCGQRLLVFRKGEEKR